MKTISAIAILGLFVISIATPWITSAHSSGPSANGSYHFVMEDGLAKSLEFEAQVDERSNTTGHMTFTDEAGTVEWDLDGERERPEPTAFSMTADLNTLIIESNRALMGGVVRESSDPSYVGKWVQLVVEDNGDNTERPDNISWCFCQPEPGGWIPQDLEDPRDQGASMSWWVTDLEREDDRGLPSESIIPGTRTSCRTFALSTYEFPEVRGEGQVQVSR